jgi:TAP-like protein
MWAARSSAGATGRRAPRGPRAAPIATPDPGTPTPRIPALVIGTTLDPATPHSNARRVPHLLGNAILLTHDGYGHTSEADPSHCVELVTSDYLVDLIAQRREPCARQTDNGSTRSPANQLPSSHFRDCWARLDVRPVGSAVRCSRSACPSSVTGATLVADLLASDETAAARGHPGATNALTAGRTVRAPDYRANAEAGLVGSSAATDPQVAVAVGQRCDVRRVYDHPFMPQNFIACDRGQSMLLPPDLTDWVPDDHVVWSILGAVDQMDLSAFYGVYRANGQGRAAYDPAMMA